MLTRSGPSGAARGGFGETARRDYDRVITRRRILYWVAAMVVLLVVGTIVGLIWADTSDVAGAFAVVTNIVGAVGIVLLLIALAVERRRRPS
jgi:membrane protein YdbS with pleckstrin-like domain